MPIPCTARPHGSYGGPVVAAWMRPWAGRLGSVALSVALPINLGGCTATVQGLLGVSLWAAVVALALALAFSAALAYLLGSVLARQRGQAELRSAREALRHAERLHLGCGWQTDQHHQLLAWRAPGQPAAADCLLFDPSAPDAGLLARLQAGQAFAGLRVRGSEAINGSAGWELRGVPRIDDEGRFAGFVGSARPTDDDDAQQLAASALMPLLAASPAPTLLALRAAQGWQVQQLNPAAQALWPQVAVGSALDDALAQLPAAVASAVHGIDGVQGQATAPAQDVQGWRVAPVGPLPGHALALLLSKLAEETPGAQAHARESDTYTFTLSHDLRAPIRVVEGFTRIVKEDYGRLLDRVGNDHLDRVLGAAARMNLMIDALLTLARLSQQPLARQRVNLSQLAGYVVDDLRRAAPERTVEVDIEPGLSAWGDPTLLRLVLENLIGNAWKYTGRCTQPQITMHSVPHGEASAFVVRDNGAGFDMRSADRLFGLFQRLHSTSDFPGHGVGLASVRRIVQRHGGEIWAEGEPGRGAAFYFTLPN